MREAPALDASAGEDGGSPGVMRDAGFDSGADGFGAVRDAGVYAGDAQASQGDAQVSEDAKVSEADAEAAMPHAALVILTPSRGALVPEFHPDVPEYLVELPLGAASVELVFAADAQAVVEIAGARVTSGDAWRSPSLVIGDNAVALTVSQPGLQSRSYAVNLRRSRLPLELPAPTSVVSELGVRVALSQHTLAVGGVANGTSRLIEVWKRAGDAWQHAQSLVVSECAVAARRMSLSLDGAVLVMGCSFDPATEGTSHVGSAYVFTREADTWVGPTRLRANDGLEGDWFGESVAVSGETIVVGAPFASPSDGHGGTLENAGSVYVFKRVDGSWQQQARLSASQAGASDGFGAAVAVYGNTLVASAPLEDDDSGAAYVFALEDGHWVESAHLKAVRPDPSVVPQHGGDQFGGGDSLMGPGLALWEDTLAIGAAGEELVVDAAAQDPLARYAADVGAVYIFKRSNGSWSQDQRIVPSVVSGGGLFGASISLWGDRLLVGAWQHDGVGAGFNDPQGAVAETAPAGAAFSFMLDGSKFVEVGRLGAAQPAQSAYAGWSVAVSEHAAVIGCPGDGPGAAYVFP